MLGVSQTLVAGCVCWLLTSSLWVYPHSLCYFNESIGGPLNGPKHLLGSNVDWGQDLLYLAKSNRHRFVGRPTYLAYFGSFDPGRVGFSDVLPLSESAKVGRSSAGDSGSPPDARLNPGSYAISVNVLNGKEPGRDGTQNISAFVDTEMRTHFENMERAIMAGGSIWVFDVVP